MKTGLGFYFEEEIPRILYTDVYGGIYQWACSLGPPA